MKNFLIFCLLALISISSISAQNRQLSIYNNDEELVFRVNLSDIGHIDILDNNSGDDNNDTEDPEPPVNSIPEGDGTEESPLNVTQAINYDNKDNLNTNDDETKNPIYVSGYIVGWSKNYRQEDIQFGLPSEDEYTNANKIEQEWIERTLVIADTPTELDYTKCLIIVLPESNDYNLHVSPSNMNKIIKVHGKLFKYNAEHFQYMDNTDVLSIK